MCRRNGNKLLLDGRFICGGRCNLVGTVPLLYGEAFFCFTCRKRYLSEPSFRPQILFQIKLRMRGKHFQENSLIWMLWKAIEFAIHPIPPFLKLGCFFGLINADWVRAIWIERGGFGARLFSFLIISFGIPSDLNFSNLQFWSDKFLITVFIC